MENKGQPRVRVGVGVFLTSPEHPGCVLIGKRKGSSGSGTYALPGGHLEFSEEWHDCASRETLEETGLCITNISFGTVVNSVLKEQDYHYVTIFMKAEVDRNSPLTEPVNKEPEKCEGWFWCEWHSSCFPSPLFDPLRKTRQQGYDPFKDDMTSEWGSRECISNEEIFPWGVPDGVLVAHQSHPKALDVQWHVTKGFVTK